MTVNLTTNQQAIIDFLADWYTDGVSWSPTLRAIAADVGCSHSTVKYNLEILRDAGLVRIPVTGVYQLVDEAADD